jgi:hypothetical protein
VTRPAAGGSLTIVGTGIRLAGQTTMEAVAAMERAEKLFYLVTDAATEAWMKQLNPTAESLADLYAEGKSRLTTYREMSGRLVAAAGNGQRVCGAFYGHPGVFVNASHHAIKRARARGIEAVMLPGISAEDCLFADLGVNPGDNGCQSFEATDFLAFRRRFDPTSELVLYQVGVLGEGSVRKGMCARPERLQTLVTRLERHYPARHRVTLYEAASFPGCRPAITRMALRALPQRPYDRRIMRWYDDA